MITLRSCFGFSGLSAEAAEPKYLENKTEKVCLTFAKSLSGNIKILIIGNFADSFVLSSY